MTDRKHIERYLLGTASPEEREKLENRYLSDAGVFEEMTEVENDLIDSYARGHLSSPDKEALEREFMDLPERRARINFARALERVSGERAEFAAGKKSLWKRVAGPFLALSSLQQWGLAASALVLVLSLGSLWMSHNRALEARLERSKHNEVVNPAAPVNDAAPTSNETEIAKAEKPELSDFAVRLEPGAERGVEAPSNVHSIPTNATWLRFQLVLDGDDYAEYVADLETAEGKKIKSLTGLKSQTVRGKKLVVLRLQATLIHSGDYVIELRGHEKNQAADENVETYTFRAFKSESR